MKLSILDTGLVAVIAILCTVLFMKNCTKNPTLSGENTDIVRNTIQRDSIELATLKQRDDSLSRAIQMYQYRYDSLEKQKDINLNNYLNESTRVRNLPMSDRIRLITKELDTPDTIGWR